MSKVASVYTNVVFTDLILTYEKRIVQGFQRECLFNILMKVNIYLSNS